MDTRPSRIAADYLRMFGGEAILRIDAAIELATCGADMAQSRLLQQARLRLRRLQLVDQITQRLSPTPQLWA